MAWGKNGTPDTLSGAGTNMEIADLTAKKFNIIFSNVVGAATLDSSEKIQYNNNTNSVYAYRRNNNGSGETTATSQDHALVSSLRPAIGGTEPTFSITYVCSISGEEKLAITKTVYAGASSGASTAPDRQEWVHKFVPSPDADITVVDITSSNTNFNASSNLSAIGTD